jgi:hypothetical protein
MKCNETQRNRGEAMTPSDDSALFPRFSALPRELWSADLDAATTGQIPWLWHGLLAPGNLTLLTSQWKSGKTTLLSVLLARRKAGGELLGLGVTAGKTVVISEESPAHWQARQRHLDFGEGVCFFCRPFAGKPRACDWLALVERLGELRRAHGTDLVVVDPLASFLPGRDEGNAAGMLEALMPLQRLSGQGVAVLVLHHPRKGEPAPGQAARGSGALSGYVDILVEMSWLSRADTEDRRRLLRAWSRHAQTPRELVIELNAEGTDYECLGDFKAEEFRQNWEQLRGVLEGAPRRLTRAEVLEAWPREGPRPSAVTLWRWLEQAVAAGLVCRDGDGRRNNPYRYWLAGQEERWAADPVAQLRQQQEEGIRLLQEQIGVDLGLLDERPGW